MPKTLLIDADPGIGDALAIIAALLDPDVHVVALTATAGCVSGKHATRNIQAIVDAIDPSVRPRMGGCAEPHFSSDLTYRGADVEWAQLHGKDGLGNWPFGFAELHAPRDSVKLIKDVITNSPLDVTVLTLGPLTNLCRVIESWPELPSLVNEIICLGGAIDAGGDVTAAAEFNMYADPVSAQSVLRSPITKTLVPRDACTNAVMTFQHYDRWKPQMPLETRVIMEALIPYAFRASRQFLGLEGLTLPEVVALAVTLHPKLCEREPMAVDVETTGELTRGTTVFDRRAIPHWQTNIEVVHSVDAQGVLDYFANVITRPR
ncbi:nucleoside hydrolase [Calycomorphotria hydatis]|uniref:Pyrimidine-specific ribonucleoside hydrolase RihA n=1 Tax=Calycomorphotria hydatis TaxID=2528027 RepID=A0A517T7Z9_9PLAN|nr:nucleoside hydrolase [Calycomorphotria hydatis]QDT64492.1 Pyrimidine-specific ribonucleoside hydrolase RihA [Calycomorphotria hydatis]